MSTYFRRGETNVDTAAANFTPCGKADVLDQHESSVQHKHRSADQHLARPSLNYQTLQEIK